MSILFGCVVCVWNGFPSNYQKCIFYWGRHTIKKNLISTKKLRTSFAFAWGSASDFRKCLDTRDPWHLEEQLPRKSLRGKTGWKTHHEWIDVFRIKNGALLQLFMLVFRGIRSWNSWNFQTKASWKLEQLQVYQLSLGFCQLFFLAGSVGNPHLFKGGVTFLETIWQSTITREIVENWFFSWKLGELWVPFWPFFGGKESTKTRQKNVPIGSLQKREWESLVASFLNIWKVGVSCCQNWGLQ